jgi:hypothetical protein
VALVVDIGRPRIRYPLDVRLVVRRDLLGQLGTRDPGILRDAGVWYVRLVSPLPEMPCDPQTLGVHLLQLPDLESTQLRPAAKERRKKFVPNRPLLRELDRLHSGEILGELLHDAWSVPVERAGETSNCRHIRGGLDDSVPRERIHYRTFVVRTVLWHRRDRSGRELGTSPTALIPRRQKGPDF